MHRIQLGVMSIVGIIVAKRGYYVDVKTSIGDFTVHFLQTEIEETPEAYNGLEQKLRDGYQSMILTNKYDKPVNHLKK